MTTHVDAMPADAIMAPPKGVETGAEIYHQKLGMWIFLLSEIMFFTALIGSYLILRFSAGEWATPGEVLNVPITATNTFILICSSVTMVKAYAAIADGNQKAHGNQKALGSRKAVYLDYAATTPVDPRVAQKMSACLLVEGNFGNPASRSHVYG